LVFSRVVECGVRAVSIFLLFSKALGAFFTEPVYVNSLTVSFKMLASSGIVLLPFDWLMGAYQFF
jgi:hypothetical protein